MCWLIWIWIQTLKGNLCKSLEKHTPHNAQVLEVMDKLEAWSMEKVWSFNVIIIKRKGRKIKNWDSKLGML